jgi:hypothetical protein
MSSGNIPYSDVPDPVQTARGQVGSMYANAGKNAPLDDYARFASLIKK